MIIKLDKDFAIEYCVPRECPHLTHQPAQRFSTKKRSNYLCRKSELFKVHVEEHFLNGGGGVAKLIKENEETIVLESFAKVQVGTGKADVVSDNPLVIKSKTVKISVPVKVDRPLISVNISMTADGKSRLPRKHGLERIGNAVDMDLMKERRAEADAVIVGARTLYYDNTALRVPENKRRKINGLVFPLRIVIVGERAPSPHAKVFDETLGGSVLLACGNSMTEKLQEAVPGVDIIECGKGNRVNPKILADKLRKEFGAAKLLIEGGPTVIGLFLDADLIDRYHVTVCPYLYGGEGEDIQTPIGGYGVSSKESRAMTISKIERASDWVFVTYDRKR